jgi:acetolactate synthase-1/2/3 large subunit
MKKAPMPVEQQVGALPAARQAVITLTELGAKVAFGIPGIHNLALWAAIAEEEGLRLITVHHEQTAAYAADGWARATGSPGLCLTTTGPGAANTIAAIGEAWASRSPVVVLASDVSTTLRRPGVVRGSLHECADQAALFAPVTKARFVVERAEELADTIATAWRTALAPPSRPVYVGVPTDLFSASTPRRGTLPAPPPAASPRKDEIEAAARLLDASPQIVLWAGGGAVASGAGPQIGRLAAHLGAPVITSHRARGIVPPEHPCYVGLPPHEPPVGELLARADYLLAFGTDFDGPMTRNWAMPRPPMLVHVNVDPEDMRKNFPADVAVQADAALGAEALLQRCAPRQIDLPALRARLDEVRRAVWDDIRNTPLTAPAAQFIDTLSRTLPPPARLVTDMTLPGHWVAGYLETSAPRRIFPPGWGTLGMGLPLALGVAAAGLGPVLAVVGDGGFLYAAGELATAVRESLPVVTLIFDDGGYGAIRYDQANSKYRRFGVDWESPDFVAWAQAARMPAERVTSVGDDLSAALTRAFQRGGPSVIVVQGSLPPPRSISLRWASGR